MRFLFCSAISLSKELGASKVVVELAEELDLLGVSCDLIGPEDLCPKGETLARTQCWYAPQLREYLRRHAAHYDVVDYEHVYLPYPRGEFSGRPLFVARSVLLAHHLALYPVPSGRGWRARVGALVRGRARRSRLRGLIKQTMRTLHEADLINLCNDTEKAEMVRRGVPADKIIVVPFGISRARRPLFDAVPSVPPEQPVMAFVGTFDPRKGANEFPRLVRQVAETVPEARFRLLGTAGMFATEADVLACFPARFAARIEVMPRFAPEALPALLAPCSVGVFPSYVEGFPFGVLEMLAASVPVIAYDSPGAPMMLEPEYLVPRGDVGSMGDRVVALMRDRARLGTARAWAKERSQRFSWQRSAEITYQNYVRFLSSRGGVRARQEVG